MDDLEDILAERLRTQDRDRYLTSLFAPAARRPDLQALYAFNLEIARIRELVSEPMIGEIRLAWWQESIAGIYAGTPRHHDVIDLLAPVIERHGLPETEFERLIEARRSDFEDLPFANLAELETYADESSVPLMSLAARVLGAEDVSPDVLRAGGIAWALSGILRSVGFHAAQGHVALPRDLLMAQSIDAHDLVAGDCNDSIRSVIREVADLAGSHLERFRAGAACIPKSARPAFLPVTLATADLQTLAAANYDPFSHALLAPRPKRLGLLIWRGVFGW